MNNLFWWRTSLPTAIESLAVQTLAESQFGIVKRQTQNSADDSTGERELFSLPNLHQSPISVVRFVDRQMGTTIYSAEQDSGKNELITWPSTKMASAQEGTSQLD